MNFQIKSTGIWTYRGTHSKLNILKWSLSTLIIAVLFWVRLPLFLVVLFLHHGWIQLLGWNSWSHKLDFWYGGTTHCQSRALKFHWQDSGKSRVGPGDARRELVFFGSSARAFVGLYLNLFFPRQCLHPKGAYCPGSHIRFRTHPWC